MKKLHLHNMSQYRNLYNYRFMICLCIARCLPAFVAKRPCSSVICDNMKNVKHLPKDQIQIQAVFCISFDLAFE